MKTWKLLLPFFISILIAIGVTYLVIIYLHLIIVGVLLLIVAVIIFGVVLAATWLLLQIVALPYYALTKVKPKEEESKGGYKLGKVKEARSEEEEE